MVGPYCSLLEGGDTTAGSFLWRRGHSLDSIFNMISPSIPENEIKRLATLAALKLEPQLQEERFDRITRVAAALFDVPIAMINLIDSETQTFKSCVGLPPGGKTDRRVSFCGHTILQDEPLIIDDALNDERFKDNPIVTGEMHIRSYIGIAIHAIDGTKPGSLCLIDTKPRAYSEAQISLLKDLAAWVEIELNSSNLRASLDQHAKDQSELQVQLEQVGKMNQLMVGRELKMTQLKAELAELENRLASADTTI